jgi:hypothetical protein
MGLLIIRRDLLAAVNPIARYLIKTFVSRPVYIGMEVEYNFTHTDQSFSGTDILEMMLFR